MAMNYRENAPLRKWKVSLTGGSAFANRGGGHMVHFLHLRLAIKGQNASPVRGDRNLLQVVPFMGLGEREYMGRVRCISTLNVLHIAFTFLSWHNLTYLSSFLFLDNSRGAHYVLFLEMKPAEKESSSLHVDTAALAKEIDDNIYKSHSFFRKFKDSKQIHGSEVHLVKPGSFNELKQFILSNTSATEVQFKMPQKLRTKEMAKIMLLNRIQ
ncbi:hypothetical protein HOLleu_06800 [Holothuria leucospilota]|uniref:GH3 C-terminal domain-containing protein n=1 Tax=Holothuria leucospilota TaxID=206669 RepID=A0A9Q1CLE6_HOLLE|nr:hypothetical protein HOLleu_06800 [Holothuria leucospilota]